MMEMNNSGVAIYQMCPRRYKIFYEDKIVPIIEPEALNIGTIFHKGVEERRIPEEELESLSMDKASMVEGMIEIALDRYAPPVKTEEKMYARVNDDITLYGTIDEILEDGYISDWKTAGMKADPENYRLQLAKYIWLARENGHDVKGAKVKVVYKTRIRKKRNENDIEFANRVYNEYKENPDKYIEDFTLEISDEDIKKELDNFVEICKMIEFSSKSGVFPMNFKRCKDYGQCPYFEKCHNLTGHEYLYRIKEEDEI